MRLVIGLIGELRAGKETVGNMLLEFIAVHSCKFPKPKTAVRHRFSDVLGETLDMWGIPRSRENLQDLAVIMRGRFGDPALTNAVRHRAVNAKDDAVILDGVRWQTDFDMIRSLPNHALIYITADQRRRYERAIAHHGVGAKVGEQTQTFAEFCAAEQKPNEVVIPLLGKHADAVIENNDDDPEHALAPRALRQKAQEVFDRLIVPKLFL